MLDYVYFRNCYKMTAIDLSKQQELDADPKANQEINFTGNSDRDGNTAMFFIIEETRFFARNGKSIINLFCLDIKWYNITCNSQINRLKSGIKNGTQVTINLSSNVIGDSIMMKLIFRMNYFQLIHKFKDS